MTETKNTRFQSNFKNEVAHIVSEIESKPGFNRNLKFDAEKHLIFNENNFDSIGRLTLNDLGINKTHCRTASDLGGTNPFPLFSEEAVDYMKWELFHDENLLKEYGRLTKFAKGLTRTDFQIGGYADNTPFIKEAWMHPKTMGIMETIAGIKLKFPTVYNMGHVNVSLAERTNGKIEEDNIEELIKKKKEQEKNGDDIPSSLHWHYDSVPIVCVLMLAAPENMIGGETGIRKGDESIARVDNPRVGYGAMLQGRVVKHIATKPLNKTDRISFVASYIPADPELYDSSVITSLKPSSIPRSINDKFYPTWVNYRFERIEQNLRIYRERLMQAYNEKQKFDQMKTIEFCKEIGTYLEGTWNEFEAVCDEGFPPKLFSIPYKDL